MSSAKPITPEAYRWIDEMVRGWIGKIHDPALLRAWSRLADDRVHDIEHAYRLDFKALSAELRACRHGDVLHLDEWLRVANKTHRRVYFASYSPRQRWLLVKTTPDGPQVLKLTKADIVRFQPARTDIGTRYRAALEKLRHEAREMTGEDGVEQ